MVIQPVGYCKMSEIVACFYDTTMCEREKHVRFTFLTFSPFLHSHAARIQCGKHFFYFFILSSRRAARFLVRILAQSDDVLYTLHVTDSNCVFRIIRSLAAF